MFARNMALLWNSRQYEDGWFSGRQEEEGKQQEERRGVLRLQYVF